MKISVGDYVISKEKLPFPFEKTHKNVCWVKHIFKDTITITDIRGEESVVEAKKLKPSTQEEYISLLEFMLLHSLKLLSYEETLEDIPENFLPFNSNKTSALEAQKIKNALLEAKLYILKNEK